MALKQKEIEVSYSIKCFPFESSALALIEYTEGEEGKEIEGVYLPEYVHQHEVEGVKDQARKAFYNWAEKQETI